MKNTNSNLLKPDGAKKNFVFQTIYQTVVLVVPLVVSPYLTRTLGSTSLGIYTYTYSIAGYFVLFAMLGINKYGQRIIANCRTNVVKLRETFWSLYIVHLAASLFSILFYILYILFICRENTNIAAIQAVYVCSATLDITWLFYGLEKFKVVALRNAIVKFAETACILLLVKEPADLWIYTVIMCASVCIGQAVMLPQAISAIPPIKVKLSTIKEHIKPLFTLFAAVVAASLYTTFDKTLLGILATKADVAFYEYSNKIILLPKTFIAIIGTVLFPKASILATNHKYDELKKNFKYTLMVTYFIGFASFFGLLAVSDLFAILYYGEEFAICGDVIATMCPLILIIGVGEAVRSIYVYPMGKDISMVKILFLNAAVNLLFTIMFIPVLGIYGAVLGTTLAETTGLICEVFICRKVMPVKDIFKDGIPFFVIGIVMYAAIKSISFVYDRTLVALLVQVVVGAFIYITLVILYGMKFNPILRDFLLDTKNKVLTRLKNK